MSQIRTERIRAAVFDLIFVLNLDFTFFLEIQSTDYTKKKKKSQDSDMYFHFQPKSELGHYADVKVQSSYVKTLAGRVIHRRHYEMFQMLLQYHVMNIL